MVRFCPGVSVRKLISPAESDRWKKIDPVIVRVPEAVLPGWSVMVIASEKLMVNESVAGGAVVEVRLTVNKFSSDGIVWTVELLTPPRVTMDPPIPLGPEIVGTLE
jgi:hypothetical protein